jgi:hypothetical protein
MILGKNKFIVMGVSKGRLGPETFVVMQFSNDTSR